MTTYDRDYHSDMEEFEKRLANIRVYPLIQTLVKVWGEGGSILESSDGWSVVERLCLKLRSQF